MTALTSQALGHRSSDSASQQGTRAASLADEDRRLLEDAERALADRPNISMSLRISMSMLLCFLLVVGVVVASMVLVSKVGTLQEYLDKVSTYALEVENTRRYEKNYLLYGTGLDDALTQVQAAESSAAVERLAHQRFHVVVTDLKMKGPTGIDVLVAVKNQKLPTEVIVITGYRTMDATRAAECVGPTPFSTNRFTWSSCATW